MYDALNVFSFKFTFTMIQIWLNDKTELDLRMSESLQY